MDENCTELIHYENVSNSLPRTIKIMLGSYIYKLIGTILLFTPEEETVLRLQCFSLHLKEFQHCLVNRSTKMSYYNRQSDDSHANDDTDDDGYI